MVSYGYIRQTVVFETNALFDEIKFFENQIRSPISEGGEL
jgi:hypothetical protein